MKKISKFFVIRKRTLVITLAVLALGAVAAWLIVKNWPEPEPELPVVHVAPVVTDNVEIYGEYVGRVRAQQFVEVHARVEGYLESMTFDEDRKSVV